MKYFKRVINKIDHIKRKNINWPLKISAKLEKTTFKLSHREKDNFNINNLVKDKKKS